MVCCWLWIGALAIKAAASEGVEYCDYRTLRQSSSFPGFTAELCILKSNNKHMEESRSIILATQGGVDRLDHIQLQAERWNGPVFAALLIQSNVDKTQLVKQFPGVHLTLVQINGPINKGYPTNFMRNVVLASIQLEFQQQHSPLVLLLDADAIPNQSEYEMRSSIDVASVDDLYVVPAFDLLLEETQPLPTSKSELVQYLWANKADIMHAAHAPSYSLDNLELWSSSTVLLLPYEYKIYREPYILASLQVYLNHMFYEAFVGRGYNKQAFHFELWASGRYQYRVLPNSFVINLANPTMPTAVTSLVTKQVWAEFRTFVATRYGLLCRESFWRLCDERGMHCDEICTHPTVVKKKKPERTVVEPPLQVNNAHCLQQSIDVIFSEQWDPMLLEYAASSILMYAKWATRILLPLAAATNHNHPLIVHVDNIHDAITTSQSTCFLYLPAGAFLVNEMKLQDYHVPNSLSHVGRLWSKQELVDLLRFKDPAVPTEEHDLVLMLPESAPQRALWELQWKHKHKYQWLVITSPLSSSLHGVVARLFPWQEEEEECNTNN